MLEISSFRASAQLRSILTAGAASLFLSACASPDGGADVVQLEQEIASSVGVIRVKASGSGCPRRAWSARVSNDRTRVTLAFDRFTARSDKTASRECDVQVAISGADGYQYTVTDLAARGEVFGTGDADGEATIATRVAWKGSDSPEDTVTTTVGDAFEDTREVSGRWSACRGTRELHLRPQLTVQRGSASLDEQEIHLNSRLCSDESAPDASVPPTPRGPQLVEDDTCGKATVTRGGDGIRISFVDHSLDRTAATMLASKTCHLTFKRVFEDGKTYAVQSYVVEGTVDVPASANAVIRTIPYVVGEGWPKGADGEVIRAETTLKGPHTGPFKVEASFSDADLTFAPCDGTPLLGLDVTSAIVSVGTPQSGGSVRLGSVRAIKFKERACAR